MGPFEPYGSFEVLLKAAVSRMCVKNFAFLWFTKLFLSISEHGTKDIIYTLKLVFQALSPMGTFVSFCTAAETRFLITVPVCVSHLEWM